MVWVWMVMLSCLLNCIVLIVLKEEFIFIFVMIVVWMFRLCWICGLIFILVLFVLLV